MIKTGYKVVTYSYQSIVRSSLSSDLVVNYKVGEFVEPKLKGSCLFVFDDINNAINFARSEGGIAFKCEYEPKLYKNTPLVSVKQALEFWLNKLKKKKTFDKFEQKWSIPNGTCTASKVKLLGRIY